jgi:hypothetical protein
MPVAHTRQTAAPAQSTKRCSLLAVAPKPGGAGEKNRVEEEKPVVGQGTEPKNKMDRLDGRVAGVFLLLLVALVASAPARPAGSATPTSSRGSNPGESAVTRGPPGRGV